MPRYIHFRFSIKFIFCLILLTAAITAVGVRYYEDLMAKDAFSAELELCGLGVLVTGDYDAYQHPRTKPPMANADVFVEPSLCYPAVDLTYSEMSKGELYNLIPILKRLRPSEFRTHVGIFLPPKFYSDTGLLKELQNCLPKCRIFEKDTPHVLRGID